MGEFRLSEVNLRDYINKDIRIKGLVTKVETKVAKNNSTYAIIYIRDNRVETDIKWFDYVENSTDNITAGRAYSISVVVQEYDRGKDGVSLLINKGAIEIYSECNEPVDTFFEIEEGSEWAYHIIDKYLSEVSHTKIGNMTLEIINEHFKEFSSLAAARGMHHTGIKGLLVHSAGVCEQAVLMCDSYNNRYGPDFVNRTLVICGALLHDIGKVKELAFDITKGGCDYTPLSALETHVTLGLEIIISKATVLGLLGTPEINELLHIIASHHEKKEYGAPIEPSTIEAVIVSMADNTDAKVNRFYKALSELKAGESVTEWKNGSKLTYYKSSCNCEGPNL